MIGSKKEREEEPTSKRHFKRKISELIRTVNSEGEHKDTLKKLKIG